VRSSRLGAVDEEDMRLRCTAERMAAGACRTAEADERVGSVARQQGLGRGTYGATDAGFEGSGALRPARRVRQGGSER
jgi:hypothetical protein